MIMRAFIKTMFICCITLSVNAQMEVAENTTPASPCFQVIKGEVRDRVTNDLLPNTIISLEDATGNPISSQMVQKDAMFSFKVACGTDYRLKAMKKSYTLEAKKFKTTAIAGAELKTKILLDKGSISFIKKKVRIKKKEAKINTTNSAVAAIDEPVVNEVATSTSTTKTEEANKETIVEETEAIANVEEPTKKEETVEQQKSTTNSIATLEEKIEDENVIAVVEESVEVKEDNTVEELIEEEKPEESVATTAIETKKNVDNKDVLVIEPVLFDYESSYLNKQAKKELGKIVVLMKKNPDLILECASYTDAKGEEKYNMWMSKRRAKRTVDYIVNRGVSPARISGKGYGETKLIKNCEDDCTDEERAVNRRTEFIIVKM